MANASLDYRRIDPLSDPKYVNDYKYNTHLNGVPDKQNYIFNYGLQTGKRDHVTYYSKKDCHDVSDLAENQILIEIMKISKDEADQDFRDQINKIIDVEPDSVVATENLKNVKYDIRKFLDKNLKEYYGYNILTFCDRIIEVGVKDANVEYESALLKKTNLDNNKTKLTSEISETTSEIISIADKINKTMDKRRNVIINGNAQAKEIIKDNFLVKTMTEQGYELAEEEREEYLVNLISQLTSSIFKLTTEINEEIEYNKKMMVERESDVNIIHGVRKKGISDLTKTNYIKRYNTVKTENDKFKKTWDGIVNADFMNDLKGNYDKKYTTYIEIANNWLFYTYYIVVLGFAYYLFVYSVSSIIFAVVCIIFFILFPFFIHSLEILVYNGISFFTALIYGTVYNGDNDKMDEFKTPMVYSVIRPLQPT